MGSDPLLRSSDWLGRLVLSTFPASSAQGPASPHLTSAGHHRLASSNSSPLFQLSTILRYHQSTPRYPLIITNSSASFLL
ncbi:hypothetical protein N7471_000087 [Penicillium samsonianum]|uniref:uncharacterized protein n=1 Tax=Penicillium samsonianum TaxID=1882272 RepID=UPI0025493758|nr:uncharacterized protein N7471_000087 [Penicillium samsonianum]KAJ6148888.1 hypothetical protein N7471_000087 [Penicillium samsonianum]